jgi:sugar (pentulose or hexulose) kinase
MTGAPLWLGLDVGTSAVKAAAYLEGGNRVGAAREGLGSTAAAGARGGEPALDPRHIEGVALATLASVLRQAGGVRAHPVRVLSLTTQRDTLLGVDREGRAVTPLLSWRDRRRLGDLAGRRDLLAELPSLGPAAGGSGPPRRVLPLEAWLLERWSAGPPVPGLEGVEVVHAGGDKNCEYLALGVAPDAPSLAAISLGSAISLGMAVGGDTPPEPVSGVVVTKAAGGHGWNVETGILSGMQGRQLAAERAGVHPWTGPLPLRPEPDLCCVPHFGGALDDPTAEGIWEGPGGGAAPLDPSRVARAWAEGVARELARLRPRVERVAGATVERVRVCGGGAMDPAWGAILEGALRVPVTLVEDPWTGCRGAVLATRGSSR